MKEFLTNHKKIIIITTIVLILLALTIFSFAESEAEYEEPVVEKVEKPKKEKEKPKETTIKVDIKGEINASGVYELKSGERVSDLIEKAGGLTKNADTSLLNLSKILKDEMVVIIYSKAEVKKLKEGKEKECECPKENDACITNEADEILITKKQQTGKETKGQTAGKISINTATIEELQTLTGIGEAKAKAIINYRLENGNFKTIEDLKNVNGIGDAVYEKIKDNITI